MSDTKTIIPAFFIIEASGAEEADLRAALLTEGLNADLKAKELLLDAPTNSQFFPLRSRLFLCELSPSTELDRDDEDPHTLEGYTCDAGSDRSATALVQRIAAYGEANDTSQPTETLSAILQLAHGWLRQRMTLHPTASTQPAPGTEQQDAASLLLHAYAKADAQNTPLDRTALREAFTQAVAEHPGAYAQLRDLYRNPPTIEDPA